MAGFALQNNDAIKQRFVAAKPPPSHVFEQVAHMAAEENADYF